MSSKSPRKDSRKDEGVQRSNSSSHGVPIGLPDYSIGSALRLSKDGLLESDPNSLLPTPDSLLQPAELVATGLGIPASNSTKANDRRPQVNLRISPKTKEKLSALSSWSSEQNPIVKDGLISSKDFNSKYDLWSSNGFKSETALSVLILEAEVDRIHTHHQNVRDIGRIYELLRDGKNENEITELAVNQWGIPKAVLPALISVSKKWLIKEKIDPEAERIKKEAKKRLAELAKLDDFNEEEI